MSEAKVWVGCLGCYNEMRLVGEWVDAIDANDVTVAKLHTSHKVKSDIYTMSHEELWVMDFEGFGGWLKAECSPMEAQRIAGVIEAIEADHIDPDAVTAWADNLGLTIEDWTGHADDFGESYQGEWDSEEDFAQNLAEDIGAVDDSATWPNDCIDWERATRELFYDYWSERAEGGRVYVFRSI